MDWKRVANDEFKIIKLIGEAFWAKLSKEDWKWRGLQSFEGQSIFKLFEESTDGWETVNESITLLSGDVLSVKLLIDSIILQMKLSMNWSKSRKLSWRPWSGMFQCQL